jgi:hypothetical protein
MSVSPRWESWKRRRSEGQSSFLDTVLIHLLSRLVVAHQMRSTSCPMMHRWIPRHHVSRRRFRGASIPVRRCLHGRAQRIMHDRFCREYLPVSPPKCCMEQTEANVV